MQLNYIPLLILLFLIAHYFKWKHALEKNCKHSKHFSRTSFPSSCWYNKAVFHFPIFSSWRSELFQNCIHGSPSKTWEFHFQITWRAESSFSPSFSKWIYLHVYSCDMTSIPYPHVVKSLDTLCSPHLTHRQVIMPIMLLGSRRGVRTWAGASGNPTGCSLLHSPPKPSEPEFPYLKNGK